MEEFEDDRHTKGEGYDDQNEVDYNQDEHTDEVQNYQPAFNEQQQHNSEQFGQNLSTINSLASPNPIQKQTSGRFGEQPSNSQVPNSMNKNPSSNTSNGGIITIAKNHQTDGEEEDTHNVTPPGKMAQIAFDKNRSASNTYGGGQDFGKNTRSPPSYDDNSGKYSYPKIPGKIIGETTDGQENTKN